MSSRPMEQGGHRGFANQESQQPESTSVIDQYSNFDGTYNSSRDLRIEGQVKGTIVCRGTLHVAQGATVNATVEAENISVAGELEGEIHCRGRMQLLQTGRVKGKITTQSLVIHEGAVYEGEMEMLGQGTTRRSRVARQAESPSAASEPVVEPDREREREREPVAQNSAANTFIRRFGGQEQQAPTPESQEPQES